jgi:hypothetical protein
MSLRQSHGFRQTALGVTALVFLLLAIRAGLHVANGEAADTFSNVKGMRISWGTALVFSVSFVAALAAAFVARWWHGRGGWIRVARFSRPRIARVDNEADGSPADMSPNKSCMGSSGK